MIILREFFIAKPGQAGKLAKMMKEVTALETPGKARVLTNETGEFNRVEMDTEFANLTEMEAHMKQYGQREDLAKIMKGYTDLYLTGGREILKVW